jgi:S-adenosylmethionine decarboxylase proenzyme
VDTFARHLLCEYRGCDPRVLDDVARIEALLRAAAAAAGATVVDARMRRFTPQGVSGVLVIEESHLAIHTWPEADYAAADLYTCGQCDPWAAHRVLVDGLRAKEQEALLVERGLLTGPAGLRVARHVRGPVQPPSVDGV